MGEAETLCACEEDPCGDESGSMCPEGEREQASGPAAGLVAGLGMWQRGAKRASLMLSCSTDADCAWLSRPPPPSLLACVRDVPVLVGTSSSSGAAAWGGCGESGSALLAAAGGVVCMSLRMAASARV
jgi:hypothetical protein